MNTLDFDTDVTSKPLLSFHGIRSKIKQSSWKQLMLLAFVAWIGVGVIVNVALFASRRMVSDRAGSMVGRSIATRELEKDANCMLKCGNHGVCKFRNRDEQSEPACLCEDSYGTFPERDCGFNTASGLDADKNIVSNCTTHDGRLFVNPDGPCSYKRVGMVNVACASWIGGGFGADWFLMLDVNGCSRCTISDQDGRNSGGLWSNRGYGAAGFFALVSIDYLGIGWLINSIRILVGNEAAIPFWDALGFLHADTIHHNFING